MQLFVIPPSLPKASRNSSLGPTAGEKTRAIPAFCLYWNAVALVTLLISSM